MLVIGIVGIVVCLLTGLLGAVYFAREAYRCFNGDPPYMRDSWGLAVVLGCADIVVGVGGAMGIYWTILR